MEKRKGPNKRNLNLWVDKDLVDKLYKLEYVPSVFFTEAVEDLLKKVENGEIVVKKSDDVE